MKYLFLLFFIFSCSKENINQSLEERSNIYGSALGITLTPVKLFPKIWGPGSNHIEVSNLENGINNSTQVGVGWAQTYGGTHCTSDCLITRINSDLTGLQPYLENRTVKVYATELNVIIEIWDLEVMHVVIKSDINKPVYFTPLTNHRYGLYAWYKNNLQKNIEILAKYN